MEIDYELIALYGKDDTSKSAAKKEMETLFDEGFLEVQEAMDIAKNHNVVILYEMTESTGYSQVLLVNNAGECKEDFDFNMEEIDALRQEYKHKNIIETFNKKDQQLVAKHIKEYGISEREFTDEFLDEFFMDKYEEKKDYLEAHIEKYFKK